MSALAHTTAASPSSTASTIIASTTQSSTQPDKTIYIGGFYPITGDLSSFGRGLIPAAQLAVNHINSRANVLNGYKLALINADTQARNKFNKMGGSDLIFHFHLVLQLPSSSPIHHQVCETFGRIYQ
jgi:ABC-type branched-subunit amino acid transport system substrate-binding protein